MLKNAYLLANIGAETAENEQMFDGRPLPAHLANVFAETAPDGIRRSDTDFGAGWNPPTNLLTFLGSSPRSPLTAYCHSGKRVNHSN